MLLINWHRSMNITNSIFLLAIIATPIDHAQCRPLEIINIADLIIIYPCVTDADTRHMGYVLYRALVDHC